MSHLLLNLINELLCLGSDKGKEKIGQYGEGFKAATLNALRNHNCGLHVIVDDKDLEFFLEDKRIGLFSLTYRYVFVIIHVCFPRLTKEDHHE